jgi:hypothetical protein
LITRENRIADGPLRICNYGRAGGGLGELSDGLADGDVLLIDGLCNGSGGEDGGGGGLGLHRAEALAILCKCRLAAETRTACPPGVRLAGKIE